LHVETQNPDWNAREYRFLGTARSHAARTSDQRPVARVLVPVPAGKPLPPPPRTFADARKGGAVESQPYNGAEVMMDNEKYIELCYRYSGRLIARREDEVIASALTLEDLVDELLRSGVNWQEITIEYISPVDAICIY
jgi:hypothetical protein